MSTPERQQDPGEHGYAGANQEPATDTSPDDSRNHPLEDPDNDSEQAPADHEDGSTESKARTPESGRG